MLRELCKMSLAGDLVIRFALVFLIYSSSTICRKTNKKRLAKRNDFPSLNSNEEPAAKCHDIYDRNKKSPSGYYDIKVGNNVFKVYCYFHSPQSTVIRQFNDLDGNPQEWNVDEPVGVEDGDPEGAMEMQIEEHEIPPGAGPHLTQPIIDEQEKMYWNKTMTIQKLIDTNNERERERKKQKSQSQQEENT